MTTIKKLDGRSAVNDANLDRASAQITKAATGSGRKLSEHQLEGLVKFLDKALPKLNNPGHRSSPVSDSVNYIDALNLKNEALALLNKAGGAVSGGEGSPRPAPAPAPTPHVGGGEGAPRPHVSGGER